MWLCMLALAVVHLCYLIMFSLSLCVKTPTLLTAHIFDPPENFTLYIDERGAAAAAARENSTVEIKHREKVAFPCCLGITYVFICFYSPYVHNNT